MATINAIGVGVRHAVARALATANLAPSEATFRVLEARVDLDALRRVVRGEATVGIYAPRPVGEWEADKLAGLVNPDGEHPLMVRVPADPPFYLDVFPVTWDRWLRQVDDLLPPALDPLCPRVGTGFARAADFARQVGKRLPASAELRAAWGAQPWPWGDRPDPGLGRSGAPRYGELPEVGLHPPDRWGAYDLGAWLWQWTAEGQIFGGLAGDRPGLGIEARPEIEPVGFRLAQDG